MYKIPESIGQVVAADTQSALASVNDAIINQSRMCATIVEASTAAHLPVAALQQSLHEVTNGLQSLVSNRASVARAVRELAEVQRLSNLREVSFGCPTGPQTFFTSASAEADVNTTA